MNKKKITFLFIGIFSVLSLFISSIQTSAQENNSKRISGIITMVLVDEMNELVEFQITDSNGNNYKYKVNVSTEFGLDESSGDRWVSTQKKSPKESGIKLIEHQKRYY